MTEAVITVFMIFATIICAYAIVVVTREIILDGHDRRADNEARRASRNETVKVVETDTAAVAAAAAEAAAKAAAEATEKMAEKVAAEAAEVAAKAAGEATERVSEEANEAIRAAAENAATTYAAVITAPVVEEEPAPVEDTPVEEVAVEEEPVEEVVEAEAIEVAEAEVIDDDGSIKFKPNARETLEEKYAKLDAVNKAYYDVIVAYAAGKDGAKQFKNVRYEEYKVGKTRLVRMLIKRGIVICEFLLHNADFKNYISENKVNVKHAPSVIKVVDDISLQAVKDSIDITMQAAEEEREYKKQQAREKRRIARANERAAAKAAKEEPEAAPVEEVAAAEVVAAE